MKKDYVSPELELWWITIQDVLGSSGISQDDLGTHGDYDFDDGGWQ